MRIFDTNGNVSTVHSDLLCHQFILVDGMFKFNDFHLENSFSQVRVWMRLSQRRCGTAIRRRKEYFLDQLLLFLCKGQDCAHCHEVWSLVMDFLRVLSCCCCFCCFCLSSLNSEDKISQIIQSQCIGRLVRLKLSSCVHCWKYIVLPSYQLLDLSNFPR